MELSSFLFGNINEEGKLEDEDLDDELRKYLTQFSNQRESSDLFKQIVDTDLAAPVPIPAASVSTNHQNQKKSSIVPLPEAIDYSDIKEEAEDSPTKEDFSREDFEEFDDLFQPNANESASKESPLSPAQKPPVTEEALLPELKAFLSEFEQHGTIKFTSLFFPNYNSDEFNGATVAVQPLSLTARRGGKVKRKEENPNADLDTGELFLLPPAEIEARVKSAPKISFRGPSMPANAVSRPAAASNANSTRKRLSSTQISWGRAMERLKGKQEAEKHAFLPNFKPPASASGLYNFQLIPWENKAESIISGREEKQISIYFIQKPYLLPHNWDLEKTAWEDCVIWNEGEIPKVIPTLNLLLNMNDPYLLFDRMNKEEISRRVTKASRIISNKLRKIRKLKKTGILMSNSANDSLSLESSASNLVLSSAAASSAYFSKPFPAERCNLSNDRFYESVKDQQKAVANAFEKVTLHHSIPALKLAPPHFRCTLSRRQLRCFHRPAFVEAASFTPFTLQFSPLKENKRAKKQREFGEVIKNSKGLTLRDDTPFALFEFLEESPLLMSNSGMGSLLNVYYRKKASKDPHIPVVEVGIPTLLEPAEPGPFLGFVDVAAGTELPVLYNNLYRAPVAAHQGNSFDFVLVRYAREGERTHDPASSHWYLRECTSNCTQWTIGQTLPCLDVYGPHSRKLNAYSRNRIQVAAYRYFAKKDNFRKRLKIASLTTLFPQFSEGTIRKWLKDYAESTRQGKDSGFWTMKPTAPMLAEEELQQLVTPEAVCQYESMLVGQQRLIDAGHASSSSGELPEASNNCEPAESDEQPIDDDLKLTPWNLTNNFLLATQGKAMLELHGVGDPTAIGDGFSFVRVPLKTQIAFRQAFETGSASSITASPRRQPSSKVTAGPFYNLPTQAEQQAAYKREIQRIWERQLERLGKVSRTPQTTPPQSPFPTDSKLVPRPFRGKRLIINRKVALPDGSTQIHSETISDARIISAYLKVSEERKKAFPATGAAKVKIIIHPNPSNQPYAAPQPPVEHQQQQQQSTLKCGACGLAGHMRTNRACPMFKAAAPTPSLEQPNGTTTAPPLSLTIKLGPKKRKAIEGGTNETSPTAPFSTDPLEAPPRRKRPLASLNGALERVIALLQGTPDSWPFHRPVPLKQFPDYCTIVSHPMDLSSAKSKCVALAYESLPAFMQDIQQIAHNCELYNGKDHYLSRVARSMVEKAEELVQGSGELAVEIGRAEAEYRQQRVVAVTEESSVAHQEVDILQ